jgi:hypothetical protein
MNFLMVFDNVENFQDILKHCWPVTPHASLLVTARPEIVAVDTIENSFEVPAFSGDDSKDLLLKLIKNGEPCTQAEIAAAKSLSKNLEGIPLALTVMGMNVRTSPLSLPKFQSFYEKWTADVHKSVQKVTLEPYYHHSLHDSYAMSFSRLQDVDVNAYELFKIICMLGPETLPSSLFRSQESDVLPEALQFCENEWL